VALRLSIGANRARVVRQLLVESLELSVLAGAVGLLLARGGLGAISALLALGENPILLNVQPNAIVLAFTIGVSLLTGVSFGLAPAFRVTGVDLTNALKSPSASGKRLRRGLSSSQALVSGQIALCVLLVAAAGLLARTLFSLETRDGGFQRDNVLMFTADVDGTPFPAEQMPRFCDDLIDRLTNRFGLLAGSCSTSVPVNTRGNARPLAVPGAPQRSLEDSLVFMNRISPAYFRAHGIGVAEGRAFSLEDVQGSERVAVISRSAARAFFGEASPLGRRVHFRDAEELMTIVGVVEDATQWSLRDDPFRTVYTPLTQLLEPEATLIVSLRTSGDPRELAADVRAEVAALDSDVIVDYVRTMDEQIAGTLVRERVLAMISSAFGLLALILSCVGLYGVIAYDVSRRARDLGIRIALGGQRADMLGRVLGSAAAVSGLGVVIGLIATLAALRALPDEMVSDLLFEIDPRDPLTLGGAVVLIVATSLLASYLPARRASGIDPATVLRTE
jgi:predicted permease